MNDYCLVIFDQMSCHCFHSTSSKSLRKNSKYQQVRNSLEAQEHTGRAWCMLLHIPFLASHVTGGYQNGNLLEKPLWKVQIPGFMCHWEPAFLWHRCTIIHLLNPSEAAPQQPGSSLESPIRVPGITQTLCELAVSQGKVDGEEMWKRPFLHQDKKFLHFFIRKELKCPCSSWVSLAFAPVTSRAGGSWQISLP